MRARSVYWARSDVLSLRRGQRWRLRSQARFRRRVAAHTTQQRRRVAQVRCVFRVTAERAVVGGERLVVAT